MATIVSLPENPAPTSSLTAESLFDAIGEPYEHAFATCTEQSLSLEWLIRNLRPGSTCLDIGCGTGRPVVSTLSQAGHDLTGIDVSGVMIGVAKRNVPGAKFEKADVKTWSPPSGTLFDAITIYFSLIAGVTQDDIRAAIRSAHGWLKPGGLLVFATVPLSAESIDIEWVGHKTRVSSLSKDEVLDAIKGPGFEIVEVRESSFLPRAVEAGICKSTDVWEEDHIFVYAKK